MTFLIFDALFQYMNLDVIRSTFSHMLIWRQVHHIIPLLWLLVSNKIYNIHWLNWLRMTSYLNECNILESPRGRSSGVQILKGLPKNVSSKQDLNQYLKKLKYVTISFYSTWYNCYPICFTVFIWICITIGIIGL